MTITDSLVNPQAFMPAVFVEEIVKTLTQWLPDHTVQPRPVRSMDPARCVGVFSVNWRVDPDSFQIGQVEPVINRYLIRIQSVVRGFNEAEALATASVDAKSIRVILYRDPDLRVRLAALQESFMNSVERFKKFNVGGQDYLSTQLTATFMHVDTTDVLIETETTFTP